jgi:transaldolase/glucose-6-phosphate isomerase
MRRPLILVASKSGTTVEPLSLTAYFREATGAPDEAFVAVTDPGTPLEVLARERGFRRTFLAPPDVGGRYAALSVFGLLPAALAGVDLAALAHGATEMARASGPNIEAARNPGLFLGALLAAARDEGRDKVTLIADPPFQSTLPWIEQLLAESTGKEGKGLYPVVGEPPAAARSYAPDRLLVYLRVDGDQDERVEEWVKAGIPVEILSLSAGARDVGAEFFRWEVATAIACHLIGVNAFDQPDVERAKEAARRILRGREADRTSRASAERHGGSGKEAPAAGEIAAALAELHAGDIFAVLAFVPRTPSVKRSLEGLRRRVRDRTGNATMLGFGPGYLHSTGQLIKGGPDRVVVLVVYAPSGKDVRIPGVDYSLEELFHAQALGDVDAMRALGRRVQFLMLDSVRQLPALTGAVRSQGKTPSKRTRGEE